jgi:hypothetical protein
MRTIASYVQWVEALKERVQELKAELATSMTLVERFANFDCFKPWGALCSQLTGGEEPCEACAAKELLHHIPIVVDRGNGCTCVDISDGPCGEEK